MAVGGGTPVVRGVKAAPAHLQAVRDGVRRRRHINNQRVMGKGDGRVDMDLVGRIGIGGKIVVVVIRGRVRGGGGNVGIMRGSAGFGIGRGIGVVVG